MCARQAVHGETGDRWVAVTLVGLEDALGKREDFRLVISTTASPTSALSVLGYVLTVVAKDEEADASVAGRVFEGYAGEASWADIGATGTPISVKKMSDKVVIEEHSDHDPQVHHVVHEKVKVTRIPTLLVRTARLSGRPRPGQGCGPCHRRSMTRSASRTGLSHGCRSRRRSPAVSPLWSTPDE